MAPTNEDVTSAPSKPTGREAADLSPEIQAELDAAMADLGVESDRPGAPKPTPRPVGGASPAPIRGPRVVSAGREHRSGKVVSVGPTDIFIEFGPKLIGLVERTQYVEAELPKVGDEIEVIVTRRDPKDGILICSKPGAVQKAAWEEMEIGQTVEARVTGVNKGGLELELTGGHEAFMPASQVSLDRVEDLSVYIGQKFTCQVQRIDRRGKGNVVLSRRDLLAVERKEKAAKLKQTITEGQVVDGVVRKIMPYGAFVDLGGLDGLLHASDITHERGMLMGEKAIAKHITEGQPIRVQILKVDLENDRISLGLKQLSEDPFQAALNEIVEGAELSGRVVRFAEFGAFVEVAKGVEGLVHISEIEHRRIGHASDVLKQDEIVKVKVLKIDPGTRKISLSIKALKAAPEAPAGSGGGGGPGGRGGKGGRDKTPGRTAEEILKETPELRRLREKFGKKGFKGGLG
ncbi:MAG: S1 RNA-binding domain-containing protein [Phycisphaeraceae bacterium]|nr:MAG: S1 RNA-binding domain-containing protein [Phycisphaeraceae bacterium]